MLVLKKEDSFRLNEFDSLSPSVQRSMLFSRYGRQTGLLNIRQMSRHDIVRIATVNGSIILFEIVDPSSGTVLIYSVSSPYLTCQYSQGGRCLGKCYIGFFVEGGEDFCFLDKKAKLHIIWKIQKIEILEEHSEGQNSLAKPAAFS